MDEYFMKMALRLARNGEGKVNPNPLVGAVIVKDGEVIGRGWHEFYGGRHAERVAIADAISKGYDLHGATLYVTLEPCNHRGKTPPCTEAIVESGISKVVVGMVDPNPIVSGKGISFLKKAGLDVEVGVLEDEVRKLNEVFVKYVTSKLPFTVLKIALTLDGFIADIKGNSKWITEQSRHLVHKLRNKYMAIMVGSETVLKDDPELTCRMKGGRNPIRIILDRRGRTASRTFKVFKNDGTRVLVFTNGHSRWPSNVEVIKNRESPQEILQKIAGEGIDSVMIEGGAKVFSKFYPFADKVHIFYAPKILGVGISPFSKLQVSLQEAHRLKVVRVKRIGEEVWWELKRCSPE
ncbi:MAG: diaminohydroxyphosphoribosylaminopyrimidine deaminase [Thermotogota bacterium]|nr:diaminohydroxyphosphoribosylaminopyrimidine deaminase [Thermotogota bacterium]MDK2865667.1 diaminohydroxyphosphoribosylaminopyrimidine deaminase [Thermotogota bacterium]